MSYRAILFLLFYLFLNFEVFADDGAYEIGPRGGSIYPINNKYIQMLKEIVIYDQKKGKFTTTFVFYNTSNSVQKVTFGFPVFPAEDSEDLYDDVTISKEKQIDEINEKLQFRTWVDNEEILREVWATDTTDDYRFAFVMTIEFQPKETKTIVNKFKQGFGYGGDNMGRNWEDITYILKSGAGWKDVIKDAKIIFKMNAEKDLYFRLDTFITKKFISGFGEPGYYRLVTLKEGWEFSPEPTNIDYGKNTLIWEFKNIEPDFNINLMKTENEFDLISAFEFSEYLDTLSSYIISNDTKNFNIYYNKLCKQKDLFKITKEYSKMLYEQYGKDILREHRTDDFSKYINQTRHIINAYAALNGYEFSNKMWYKMFKLFDWYNPKTKNPVYDTIQKTNIDSLQLFEKGKFYKSILIVEKNKEANILKNKTDNSRSSKQKNEKKDNGLYYGIFFLFAGLVSMAVIIKKRKKRE